MLDSLHRRTRFRPTAPVWLSLCVLALASCASQPPRQPQRAPDEVRAQLDQLLPANVADRAGWAGDIQSSFQLLGIPASTENLCAVLAVTEQESTFNADPQVAGLARIARAEIEKRAAARGVPKLLVDAALALSSSDGRSYRERLGRVRTEREMSELYEEIIDRVPLGGRLLANANPVRTGGPMQVSIAFAESHARERPYPYATTHSIRNEVFTRRGGMYFGIAHLLGYPNSYTRHLYRYADFNAGWYASRNAAFQAAVTAATGVKLALDGDVLLGDGRVGATESAVRSLGPELGMDGDGIRRELRRADRFEFEQGELYRRVFELAERRARRPLARAVMPQIRLQSPKITRDLTTEWFATRVQTRYQRCINRAFAEQR
jgi:hypothetical protein